MVRDFLKNQNFVTNTGFRYRGKEAGRLENFSDSVFALVITLLLISTTAPNNFLQIKRFVYELIPFTICITLIIVIWYQHYIFFYRYGLRQGKMIVLNTLFLIIVLFYVYPLKFLARLILLPISYLIDNASMFNELSGMIAPEDVADLMIIYGTGAACVFFVLRQMYVYALKNADSLELNELEVFDTRASIRSNFLLGVIPVFSVLLSLIFYNQWFAGMIGGFTYFLYTPVMTIHGRKVDRYRKKLLELQAKSERAPDELPTE